MQVSTQYNKGFVILWYQFSQGRIDHSATYAMALGTLSEQFQYEEIIITFTECKVHIGGLF